MGGRLYLGAGLYIWGVDVCVRVGACLFPSLSISLAVGLTHLMGDAQQMHKMSALATAQRASFLTEGCARPKQDLFQSARDPVFSIGKAVFVLLHLRLGPFLADCPPNYRRHGLSTRDIIPPGTSWKEGRKRSTMGPNLSFC